SNPSPPRYPGISASPTRWPETGQSTHSEPNPRFSFSCPPAAPRRLLIWRRISRRDFDTPAHARPCSGFRPPRGPRTQLARMRKGARCVDRLLWLNAVQSAVLGAIELVVGIGDHRVQRLVGPI